MTYQSLAKAAGLFLLATTILVSGGCGYKNPPIPPQSIVPEAVNDLVYTVGDKGVDLTWTRITSYNVCYTKLLRGYSGNSAFRHRCSDAG